MAIRTDLQEAVDLFTLVCERLNLLPNEATSAAAATLRRLTGAVAADAEYLLGAPELAPRLLACFQAAMDAGATFQGLRLFREQVVLILTDGIYARIVQQAASRFAVIQMARALAATDFRSLDAAQVAKAQINAVFAVAEEGAADALDTATYRALVTLHAAVARDLTTRARPLPRIVAYETAGPLPALVLAQRLYGDASRADDLVAENAARAPLFMPPSGRALSA